MTPLNARKPYPVKRPPAAVFRVARGNNPLALRPWHTVTEESPANGRFDDDHERLPYRVLYTSASPEGALRETLQRFQPAPALVAQLQQVACESGEDPLAGIGVVPLSWMATRTLGRIQVEPCDCVELATSDALDAIFVETDLRFTIADLFGASRRLTRQLSRKIFNRPEDYAGIAVPSKFGVDIDNYAFFETGHETDVFRATLFAREVEPLSPEHGLLFDLVNRLGLRFEGVALEEADDARPAWIQAYIDAACEARSFKVAGMEIPGEFAAWTLYSSDGSITLRMETSRRRRRVIEVLVAEGEFMMQEICSPSSDAGDQARRHLCVLDARRTR